LKILGSLPVSKEDIAEKSTCNMCSDNCEIHVKHRDGIVTEITLPDCQRGAAMLEHRDSDARLLEPEIRDSLTDDWRKADWDNVLDRVVDEINTVKQEHGAESVAFMVGYTKELRPYFQRLSYLFGSPNYITESSCCFSATRIASVLTFGEKYGFMYGPSRVHQPETKCRMVWTNDTENSKLPYKNHYLFRQTDVPLIVVDPRRTSLAKSADIHLQLRPGSDGALALGLGHIIIREGLHDQEFLDQWAHGFAEYEAYVKDFTPDRVAEITGIKAELIEKAAKLYASSTPAVIGLSPTATVHASNGCQNHRAIILLCALTGNIDIKGGNRPKVDVSEKNISLRETVLPELPDAMGKDRFPLFSKYYYEGQGMTLADAIESGSIKAIVSFGANVMMYPNSGRLREQLKKLKFFSVCDFFDTPTREFAQVSLPAATHLERESLIIENKKLRYRPSAIPLRGNAMADADIIFKLAKKLGLSDRFWDGDIRQSFNERLETTGYTVEELPDKGATMPFPMETTERKYQQTGFETPSGKIEFVSQELIDAGHSGLPKYAEPFWSPVSTPEIAADYPYVLTSGARSSNYTHSQGRHLKYLRAIEPHPYVSISLEDGQALEIHDDDWVRVSSPIGEIELRAKVSDLMATGVVSCPHGWVEAEINLLMPDVLCSITGFPAFKSSLCNIEKISTPA
jgi:anaerobic selenocysteine-containing dehydrogenase